MSGLCDYPPLKVPNFCLRCGEPTTFALWCWFCMRIELRLPPWDKR